MVPYDDLIIKPWNFISTYLYELLIIEMIFAEGETQKRYITEINISQVSGGMVVLLFVAV